MAVAVLQMLLLLPLVHPQTALSLTKWDADRHNRHTHDHHAAPSREELLGRNFHGQGKRHADPEDRHVFKEFFSSPPRWNGTYVEMGAADGVTISNTLFFERELGWRGLLVEPSASSYASVVRHRSSRNTMLREAVCGTRGNVTWAESSNKDVSGVAELLSAHSVHRYHGRGSYRTSITCRPLSAMLRAAALRSIDFFSLDTEGSELSVLQTMDWSVPTKVFLVELDGQNKAKDDGVRELLRSRGYRQHGERMGFRKWNELWVDPNFAPAATPSRSNS